MAQVSRAAQMIMAYMYQIPIKVKIIGGKSGVARATPVPTALHNEQLHRIAARRTRLTT